MYDSGWFPEPEYDDEDVAILESKDVLTDEQLKAIAEIPF